MLRLTVVASVLILQTGCLLVELLRPIPCDPNVDGACFPDGIDAEGEGEIVIAGEGEGGDGEGELAVGEGEGGDGEGEGGDGEGEGEEGEGEEGEGEAPPPTITLCGVQQPVPAWFDVRFSQRIPVAICDAGAPAEAVNGVVVPILITDDDLLSELQSSGNDVVVVDQRAATGVVLPHERQQFIADARLLLQVRLPTVTPRTQTDVMWLYFGAAGVADGQNVAATYAGFSAIWHGDSFVETLSGRSGLPNGVALAEGAFGGAFDHAGNAASWVFLQDIINGGPSATPPATAAGTVSAMVGPRVGGAFGGGHVLFWSDITTPASFGGDAVSMQLTIGNNGVVGFYLPSNLPLNQFTVTSPINSFTTTALSPVAASWDATNVRVFGNGNQVGSVAMTNSASFAVQNTVLGMAENNSQGQPLAGNLLGRIDELRITTAVRSDAYLRAEGRAMQQQLLVFGEVDSQ